MTQPIKVAGLAFDHIEGHVFLRRKNIKAQVRVGIADVSIGSAQADAPIEGAELVFVEYKHFISAKADDNDPFYEISLVAKLFVTVDRSVFPTDGDAMVFLDHALAFGLPASALKLKELCSMLGVAPAPLIPLTPQRAETDDDDNSDGN